MPKPSEPTPRGEAALAPEREPALGHTPILVEGLAPELGLAWVAECPQRGQPKLNPCRQMHARCGCSGGGSGRDSVNGGVPRLIPELALVWGSVGLQGGSSGGGCSEFSSAEGGSGAAVEGAEKGGLAPERRPALDPRPVAAEWPISARNGGATERPAPGAAA